MPLIDPKNTQVILIGTSKIEDENFPAIPNVITNLGKLQDLLSTVVGIDKENNIHPFFDKDNNSEINRKVIEIVPKATNTVIVYYAGHCVRHNMELYFTTTGTQSGDPRNTGAIFAGDLLQTVIDKSKPNRNIIFILDCCFSGLASKYIDDKERKVFLITAALGSKTAKDESPENENLTAFTHEFLSILEEGIDSAGENLTIRDIFDSLKQKLVSKNLPEPKITSHGSPDELEICKNPAFKKKSEPAEPSQKNTKKSIKIIFHPESQKSKNSDLVQEFIQKLFGTAYEVQEFTYKAADHIVNVLAKKGDKTAYIECKINEESSEKELKIFTSNFRESEDDDDADCGYFVHTEALSQNAAALKNKWAEKKRYENITFLDPDKIMEKFNFPDINQAISDISAQTNIYQIILAYTYFGIYYLIIPYEGNERKKYYLYDIKTNRQVVDTGYLADKEEPKISIHDALQTGIGDLAKLKHAQFVKTTEPTPPNLPKTKPHFAFLYPEPINGAFGYSHALMKGFQKFDIAIDFLYLSEANLNALEKYHYIFIFTQMVKKKLCIESENLIKAFISVEEFFDDFLWIDDNIAKGIFIFTSQPIDFTEVITEKPIANFVCEPQELEKILKNNIPHALFQKQQLNENKYCRQCLNIASQQLEKVAKVKHLVKVNESKTALPEFIDRKAIQNFVGRAVEQENLIERILKLEETVLNIKGAGGLGKTTIAKKITVHLADRGYFEEGIAFVACENFTDYQSFEGKVAACFDMDKVLNLREHLTHYSRFDKLIILDNFETLLTLPHQADIDATKDLVKFVCDYAAIVITSRQVIGYEFEAVYELSQFSTDNALTLFSQLYYKERELSLDDQKFLRTEILEELLNNNPLAIKIIAKNLPRSKELKHLKEELEQDFFAMTNAELDALFDKAADVNIERTRSLYHSINYSYQQLYNKEKLAFELLHLFPDGIKLDEFKRCFSHSSKDKNKSQSVNQITDKQIISLENKSLLESANKLKLQSIVSRFAEYQFTQRTEGEKARYFKDAYAFNRFLASSLKTSKRKKGRSYAVGLFDGMSNNILKSLDYIDKFEGNSEEKLNYIYYFHEYILDANQTLKLTDKLHLLEKNPLLNEDEILLLKLIGIYNQYHNIEFFTSFNNLNVILPLTKVFELNYEKFFPNKLIANLAFYIYENEGSTYPIFIHLVEGNLVEYSSLLETSLFRFGAYTIIDKLSHFDDDFFYHEVASNKNQLISSELKKRIDSLYVKEHLDRMQAYYILAKNERVERETIQKLVVTNPYTDGLKNLMFAFIEEDEAKKIDYFKQGIEKLAHIKYYYIEGIYLYAKYLKTIGSPDYESQFNTGYELAEQCQYRFLKHQFRNLKKGKNVPYDENAYPFPDELDLEGYIRKYNKYWEKNKT